LATHIQEGSDVRACLWHHRAVYAACPFLIYELAGAIPYQISEKEIATHRLELCGECAHLLADIEEHRKGWTL
jgi:hypothetical protein